MMVEGNNEGLEKEQTDGRGSSPGRGEARREIARTLGERLGSERERNRFC
jgi:hypothetical protein